VSIRLMPFVEAEGAGSGTAALGKLACQVYASSVVT
jgi:hypothetical protein